MTEESRAPVSLYAQGVTPGNGTSHQHDDQDACCVCGGVQFSESMRLTDTRFAIHDCAACGTGMLSPLPSPVELSSFYIPQYYGDSGQKFGLLTEVLVRLIGSRQTQFLTRYLPQGGRVLDVGCGRGVVASPLAAAGYAVTGLEISPDAVKGIDERVNVVIADSLADAPLPASEFDLVVIWHVLEHVIDPAATLRIAQRVLKPGGKLVVAVPSYSNWQAKAFGPAWFHLDPPRHLYHFTSGGLRTLLKNCGLDVLQSHHFSLRQNPFGWVQSGLNRLFRGHRNRLYSYLLNEPLERGRLSPIKRLCWFTAYVAGMAAVLPLSVLAAIRKSGGTIHYLAERPRTEDVR